MSVGSGRRCSKGVLAGALAVALLYMVARADGLHCKVLDGDDLEEAWRRLVRQTWPERKDATAPRVSSHKERPLVETAIKETLAVLQFVDAYNYADDSPAWMATEDGRNKAREQSRKILLELGRGAAPFVWQAADNEIRFSANKEKPDALVKPFRDAQKALREALALLEGERRQDGEYVKTYDAIEALRPAAHKLEFLEKIAADLRKQKIGAKDKLDKLKELETQAGEIDARIKALGDLRDLGQRMKDLQAKLAERLKVVDETPKVADLKTAADAARKKLDDAMRAAGGLGQGLLDGGDPAMVSGDDFLGTLKEVLAAMGPEALPQVSLGLRSPNPELRKFAESIQNAWTAPARRAQVPQGPPAHRRRRSAAERVGESPGGRPRRALRRPEARHRRRQRPRRTPSLAEVVDREQTHHPQDRSRAGRVNPFSILDFRFPINNIGEWTRSTPRRHFRQCR